MGDVRAVVVTSINYPTQAVRTIAEMRPDWRVIVVADRKTPLDWHLSGVDLLTLEEQVRGEEHLASLCPLNHYARKNLGYLRAMRAGAIIIAETDDDNIPYPTFLQSVNRWVRGRPSAKHGWENVYRYFTRDKIWPRGFPLELILPSLAENTSLGEEGQFDCPIQQYLADGDPDVDAVYRLTTSHETTFEKNTVILQPGTYCPFNSQNTVWWEDAYPLLYLPSFVSFRMTDIWRSLVAQFCLYALGKSLAFREASVRQLRNEHSLIRDFRDEIPGYLHNGRIVEILAGLSLSPSSDRVGDNLVRCYEGLVRNDIVPSEELPLVDAWLQDVEALLSARVGGKSVQAFPADADSGPAA